MINFQIMIKNSFQIEAIKENIKNERLLEIKNWKNGIYDDNIYDEFSLFVKLVKKYYPEINNEKIEIYFKKLMIQEKDLYSILQNKVKRENLSNEYIKLIERKKMINNKANKKNFSFYDNNYIKFYSNKNKEHIKEEYSENIHIINKRKKLDNENNFIGLKEEKRKTLT